MIEIINQEKDPRTELEKKLFGGESPPLKELRLAFLLLSSPAHFSIQTFPELQNYLKENKVTAKELNLQNSFIHLVSSGTIKKLTSLSQIEDKEAFYERAANWINETRGGRGYTPYPIEIYTKTLPHADFLKYLAPYFVSNFQDIIESESLQSALKTNVTVVISDIKRFLEFCKKVIDSSGEEAQEVYANEVEKIGQMFAPLILRIMEKEKSKRSWSS